MIELILDDKKLDSAIVCGLYACEDTGRDIVINCYDSMELDKGLRFSKAINYLDNKARIGHTRNALTFQDLAPYPLGVHRCNDEREILYIFSNEWDLFTVAQIRPLTYNMIAIINRLDDYTALSNVYDFVHDFKKVVLISTQRDRKWLYYANKRLETDDIEVKTVYLNLLGSFNSINDYFVANGAEATENLLIKLMTEFTDIDVPGVVDISTVKPEDKTRVKRYFTMIDKIDSRTGGLECGGVWLLTGKAGNGKSELAKQISLAVVQQKGKVFYYSGEETKERFLSSLQCKLAEPESIIKVPRKLYGGRQSEYEFDYVPSQRDTSQINKWLKGKYYVYDETFSKDVVRELKEKMEALYKEKGIEVFILDNMMKLTINVPPTILNMVQGEIMNMLVEFTVNYNTAVIMVAHPHKTDKNELENENISGTLNMVNLASIVISVRRMTAEEKEKMEKANKPVHNSSIRCTKNRPKGELFEIGADFDVINKIFCIDNQRPKYGWKSSNTDQEIDYENNYVFQY